MNNDVSKKKKTSKEKRVLIGALCIAAAVAAGSTFAWFTSKDEVTNRLTAAADYGVAIAEDFAPPENWVPGQQINKDVSAVNTGNVDAFTRMWLEGEMSVLARDTQINAAQVSAASSNKITPVTDEKYKNIGLTFYNDTNKKYYSELSQTKIKNPDLNDGASDADESGDYENQPATFSEVQAVQAGGYLASAPSGAQYYYVVEHNISISAATTTSGDPVNQELKEGDIVATVGANIPDALSTGHTVAYIPAGTAGIDIDSSTFTPQTEGTYIFRRNVELNATANTKDDYEYSGYYFVPKGGSPTLLAAADSTNDHYFALFTDTNGRSDYTIPDNAITETTVEPSKELTTVSPDADNMKFLTATETIVPNSDLKWVYTEASGSNPAKMTAYYAGADGALGKTLVPAAGSEPAKFNDTSKDDIVVDIILKNIGTGSEEWTVRNGDTAPVSYYAPTVTDTSAAATSLATNGLWTFYYNNDIEAGDTSKILVDSVQLSENTTQYAFLAFNFDFNVNLESIQVTMNEDGKETVASVSPWSATAGKNTGATAGTPAYDGTKTDEINNVNWAATS